MEIEAFNNIRNVQGKDYYNSSSRYIKYKMMFENFKSHYQKIRQAELARD